jgi:carbohydrate-binding DOMON domain-containing protein
MNKQSVIKMLLLIGVFVLFVFNPQHVVWGGLDFQTVPTLLPTATTTSTSTLTPTATITVTPTIVYTSTSIPPTPTFTNTFIQPVQASPTFTNTPEIVVPPPQSNWINYVLLALVVAIAIATGIIGYLLLIRKKKPSDQ